MAPLPPKDFARADTETSARVLPDAQAVISKYLSVVGSKQAGFAPIVMRGTMERLINHTTTPIEVVFKDPGAAHERIEHAMSKAINLQLLPPR